MLGVPLGGGGGDQHTHACREVLGGEHRNVEATKPRSHGGRPAATGGPRGKNYPAACLVVSSDVEVNRRSWSQASRSSRRYLHGERKFPGVRRK